MTAPCTTWVGPKPAFLERDAKIVRQPTLSKETRLPPPGTLLGKEAICELVRTNPGITATEMQLVMKAKNPSSVPNALFRQIEQGRLVRHHMRIYIGELNQYRNVWCYFAPEHQLTEEEISRITKQE